MSLFDNIFFLKLRQKHGISALIGDQVLHENQSQEGNGKQIYSVDVRLYVVAGVHVSIYLCLAKIQLNKDIQ